VAWRADVTLKDIYETIQDHFDYLDQLASAKQKLGMNRGLSVMQFSELDRDLYFVHDVLCITNNAGVGAWIYYHIEDDGWIDDAARAFTAIGHEQAARGLLAARDFYRIHPKEDDYGPYHEHIMCHEEAITHSLFAHLSDRGFEFHTPKDILK
jgi:hypothetical protein